MQCTLGQHFAQNANPSYVEGALRGHPGTDVRCGYGSPIYSLFEGYVYKVLTPEHPSNDGSGFTGVFLIVDNGIECFEWLVGHCNPCVVVGTQVRVGDLIGTEANHGTVYSGNVQITLAMQKAGSQEGAHRHYQKRPVQPVLHTTTPGYCLSDSNDLSGTYRDEVGRYYQVWDYQNGYHGCIDPEQPAITRSLYFGCTGYDVWVLQRYLAKQGFLTATPNGTFGPATAAAVFAWQKAHGLGPVTVFGPQSRAKIGLVVPTLY